MLCYPIRKYRYAYGAVEPLTGESFSLVLPYSNTVCMNLFLDELSKKYPDDQFLIVCDGTARHKANVLIIPDNIRHELLLYHKTSKIYAAAQLKFVRARYRILLLEKL